jgi:glycosyltransferase involved in cell wall biosynthesis
MRLALTALYGRAAVVLSPSSAADRSLVELGVEPERIARWTRGVDAELFAPPLARESDGHVRVLYAGRLSSEKGIDLLAEAFLTAHAIEPRLSLVLAGGGPEEPRLRAQLGDRATFLGWLDRAALARAHAECDVFCFPSTTDTYGQAVLEAQASGLAVLAVAEGGPLDLVDDGRTGLLCPPDAQAFAAALVALARAPKRRQALGRAAAAAARGRTWDAALAELAAGYERATCVPATRELAHAA